MTKRRADSQRFYNTETDHKYIKCSCEHTRTHTHALWVLPTDCPTLEQERSIWHPPTASLTLITPQRFSWPLTAPVRTTVSLRSWQQPFQSETLFLPAKTDPFGLFCFMMMILGKLGSEQMLPQPNISRFSQV